MRSCNLQWLLLVWLCALFLFGKETRGTSAIRGVNPSQSSLYENKSGFFHCLNSTQKIPYSSLNDDFCDCDDGTDEPGTAACDQSTFYCENVGYIPKNIPSSHVNDGICDCCDGSDEWLGYVACPNQCTQLAKERIEKRLVEMRTIREGLSKREELKIRSSLKAAQLQNRSKLLKVAIHEAEVLEKKTNKDLEWFEQVLKVSQLQDLASNVTLRNNDSISSLTEAVSNDETNNASCEVQSNCVEEKEASDGCGISCNEKEMLQPELIFERCKDVTKVYTSSRIMLSLEKFFFDILSKFPFLSKITSGRQRKTKTEFLQLCINNLKEQLQSLRSELERNRTELERIQQYFSIDYGPESVFFALRDTCLETDSQGYHYTLCLLSHALQDGINLGKFKQWDSNYTRMIFTDGTPCWNGPARSTIVDLLCGVNETILGVSEPSKCQYHIGMTTCAVCSIDELKRIRDEASVILSNFNQTTKSKSAPERRHDEL